MSERPFICYWSHDESAVRIRVDGREVWCDMVRKVRGGVADLYCYHKGEEYWLCSVD